MAKTKTLGIRATPELIGELEILKAAFNFESYSEMLDTLARVLRSIDQRVSQIPSHPRDWSTGELDTCFSTPDRAESLNDNELTRLAWRRLKQRFGEDGVQALQQKLLESSRRVRKS